MFEEGLRMTLKNLPNKLKIFDIFGYKLLYIVNNYLNLLFTVPQWNAFSKLTSWHWNPHQDDNKIRSFGVLK